MLKLGEMILGLLLSIFKSYTDKHAEAQVAAEEAHEAELANAPRDDTSFTDKLREHDAQWNGH